MRISGMDWPVRIATGQAASAKPIDPYLVWAELTGHFGTLWGRVQDPAATSGTGGPQSGALPRVRVLVETVSNDFLQDLQAEGLLGSNADSAVLLTNLMPFVRERRFHSLEVRLDRLADVFDRCKRLQWGESRPSLDAVTRPQKLHPRYELLSATSPARAPRRLDGLSSPLAGEPKRRVLVGLIDDGCPFANGQFRDDHGRFRVCGLWHPSRRGEPYGQQTGPGRSVDPAWPARATWKEDVRPITIDLTSGRLNPPPVKIERFPVGQELRPSDLAPLVDGRERVLYREVDYLSVTPGYLHGMHLMDLAGGRRDPLHRLKGGRGPAPVGPGHPLAFVQLPTRTIGDTSGGSLASHALDAIDYLTVVASDAKATHAVVNLSYGIQAGPHDGSSMFERALVEVLDRPADSGVELHVVLPAGNSHQARCHAFVRLCAVGATLASRTLGWQVPPDDPTFSFVEVWWPRGAAGRVRVQSPDGSIDLSAGPGQLVRHPAATGSEALAAAIIAPHRVVQGTQGTMTLVALAPTRSRRRETDDSLVLRAPHGLWRVTLENLGPAAIGVHAWVERDDVAPGRIRGGRQSHFAEVFLDADAHGCGPMVEESVDPRWTLNGIATASHPRLHVVGAMRADGGLAGYSAAGPNRDETSRNEGPDEVVVADRSRAVPGLRAGGPTSGSAAVASGTSVAAAVFTRELAASLEAEGRAPLLDPPPFGPADPARQFGDPQRAHPAHRGWFRRGRWPPARG
jgi:hypothetical protein